MKSRTFQLESHSPEETIKFAADWIRKHSGKLKIALEGDLGAGKTTFVKGLAQGLGLKDKESVTSPTFILMHVYPTKRPLAHFDLYRLKSQQELLDIGFSDFVEHNTGVVCVEWPERAGEMFEPDVHVRLETVNEKTRKIVISKN